eukprot:648152-Pyramimonas_sp.AAC.1
MAACVDEFCAVERAVNAKFGFIRSERRGQKNERDAWSVLSSRDVFISIMGVSSGSALGPRVGQFVKTQASL